mgnify:CR=1 FL=1
MNRAVKFSLFILIATGLMTSSPLVRTSWAGLLGYWTFDGTPNDLSGNGRDGTLLNGASFTVDGGGHTGLTGDFALDVGGGGDSQHMLISGFKGPTGRSGRTISAWINSNDTDDTFFSYGANVAGQKFVFRTQSTNGTNDTLRVEINGGFQVGSIPVVGTGWRHVAMTWAQDTTPDVNDVKLYLDGVEQTYSATQAQALNTAFSQDVQIGRESFSASRDFSGLIDNVAVFNRALTSTEIASLAVSGTDATSLATVAPNASLDYQAALDATPMDGSWENLSGLSTNHDWGINNNVGGARNVAVTDDMLHGTSRAYTFNGTSDTATTSTFESFSGNPTGHSASFEILFRPSDTMGDEILWETGGNGFGTALSISGSDLQFTTRSNSNATELTIASLGGLSVTDFNHLVGVLDRTGAGADLTLYLNGAEVASGSIAGFTDWAGGDNSALGQINGSVPSGPNGLGGYGKFGGEIALMRFYNTELTAADVSFLTAGLNDKFADVGGGIGDWDVAGTWDVPGEPYAANDVFVGNGTVTVDEAGSAAATLTVGHNHSSDAAQNGAGTVTITAGDLTIGGDVALAAGMQNGTLNLNGGTLHVGGNIVDGSGTSALHLSGGTLDLSGGTLDVDMLTLASGTLGNVGEINGGADITKTTGGTLTLSGTANNSYTGQTIVTGGDLRLSKTAGMNAIGGDVLINGGDLIWDANNQVADGATIDQTSGRLLLNSRTATITNYNKSGGSGSTGGSGNLTITGTFASSGGGAFDINSSAGVVNANTVLYIGGNINVGGGGGTLIIGAGGLTMQGTDLALDNGNARVILGGNVTTLASGTTAFIDERNGSSFNANRGLELTGMRTFTVADGGAAIDLDIGVPIYGTGGLTKDGAGLMQLSTDQSNTYAGTTTVNAGTLQIGGTGTDAGAIPNGDIVVNGGTFSVANNAFNGFNTGATVTINNGGTMSADNTANNAFNIGAVFINGGTLSSANGPAGPANDGGFGNWIFNGGVTVGGSTLSTIDASTIAIKSGNFNVADSVNGPSTDLLVSSRFINTSGGSNTLVKTGTGTMTLTNANTYTGATVVNDGTLELNRTAGSGGNIISPSSAITIDNAVMRLTGDQFNAIQGNTVTIQNGGVLTADSTANNAHNISGLTLNNGTLTSSGGSDGGYGNFVIGAGGVNVIGSAASTISADTIGLPGVRTFTVANVTGDAGADLLVSSVINNSNGPGGSLIKTGDGTMSLINSTNTYSGDTDVQAGTLSLGDGSVPGSMASMENSNVFVRNGAALSGNGTTGNLTVETGGLLTPGFSAGTMNVMGNLDLMGTLDIEFESAGGVAGMHHDLVNVNGTVDLGGGTLNATYIGGGSFTPTFKQKFLIIDNDGGDAVIAPFASHAPASSVFVDGQELKIYYDEGTGNDVYLVSNVGTASALYLNDDWVNTTVQGDQEINSPEAFVGIDAFTSTADAFAPANQQGYNGDLFINGGSYGTVDLTAAGDGGGNVSVKLVGDINAPGTNESNITIGDLQGDSLDSIELNFHGNGHGNLTVNSGDFAGTITGDGSLTKLTGGTFDQSGSVSITNLTVNDGTMNFSGNSLVVADSTIVSNDGASATLNVTSGSVSLGTGDMGDNFLVGVKTTGNDLGSVGIVNFYGASNVIIDVDQFYIGRNDPGTAQNGQEGNGTVTLSDTANMITANVLYMGDTQNGDSGSPATMNLGAGTNVFAVDEFTIGRTKSGQSTGGGSLVDGSAGGTFMLTGKSGAGTGTLNIGQKVGATSFLSEGTLDLANASNVNIDIEQLRIGMVDNTGTSTGDAIGTLNLSNTANSVNVNTIEIGHSAGASAGAFGEGTLTLGAGTLTTGNVALAEGNAASNGTININGGDFNVTGNVTDGIGRTTINVNNGNMDVAGSFAADSVVVGDGANGNTATLTVDAGPIVIGSGAGADDFIVARHLGNNSNTTTGTVDFSNATMATIDVDDFFIGVKGNNSNGHAIGIVTLAQNNDIIANEIVVGRSGNNGTIGSELHFGSGTNNVDTASLIISDFKNQGASVDVAAGGTVNLGTMANRTEIIVGRKSTGTGANADGLLDFSAGTANIIGANIRVGQEANNGGGGTPAGTVWLADGSVDLTGSIFENNTSGGNGISTLNVVGNQAFTIGGVLDVDTFRIGFDAENGSVTYTGGAANIGNANLTGDLFIGRRENNTGTTFQGVLDLTNTTSVNIQVDQLELASTDPGGVGGSQGQPRGTLLLGPNNTITANSITIADSENVGLGNFGDNRIALGAANVINADTLTVGGDKSQNAPGQLEFQAGGTLQLRGTAGGSSRADVFVGQQEVGTGGGATGEVDLTGGTVDLRIDQLTIGTKPNIATGPTVGTLSFDDGTVDVNSILVGSRNNAGTNGSVTGTFNQDGGDTTVNTDFRVGNGGVGTVDLSAGTITSQADALFGLSGGTGNLNVSGGVFTVPHLGLGVDAGSSGFGLQTGGTIIITDPNSMIVGDAGFGQEDQQAGTTEVGVMGVGSSLILGNQAGSEGVYNLNEISAPPASLLLVRGNGGTDPMQTVGNTIIANAGMGTFNHDAGTFENDTHMEVGNSTGMGTYNLNGGTLNFRDTQDNTQQLAIDNAASTLTIGTQGTFNFNDGTLMNVTTIQASNTLAKSGHPDNTFVQNGGSFVIGVDGVENNDVNPNTIRAITTIEDANYTLGANATLHLDIFGPNSHGGSGEDGGVLTIDPLDPLLDSDLLYVSGDPLQGLGNALLEGTLDINLNGYEPAPFHWYDVLLADGDITIDENTFMVDGVNFWRVIDNPAGPGQLLQVAVPEPASIVLWTLIGLGLASFSYNRVRRRK